MDAAVEQERQRIIQEIEKIDLNGPAQLNGLGMKILVLDIINNVNPNKEFKLIHEINLGLEEIENPDVCLCMDCQVSRGGL